MFDLRGKTVLLTGASTGLGPFIARRLHRAGARFVLSARNEAALDQLAKEVGDARVVVADLGRVGEPERLAREAGAVDVLVSNAGMPASGRLTSYSVEEIDRALAVNLRAGIVLARELAPGMVGRKSGHMVFMGSAAGKIPAAGITLYNATKFGIRGFALALREELVKAGVGVSVISPTFVSHAGMWAETGLKANPIAGEVTPERVAEAIFTAITKNKAEIDVVGLPLRASLKVLAVAPGLFMAVARSSGSNQPDDAQIERQHHKR
ncbi:MAG TPA: SDR family NAD(P)-dependent oxidoreductase [Candidatus Dormibacteraeota bacterium]|nr:SDR family NAD(P)-dependent oxidoreductase [Candidatus Dormibacteraeota bacterium]